MTKIIDDNDDYDSFPRHNFRLTLPGSVTPSAYYPNKMIGYSQGLFCFYNYDYDEYPRVAVIWNLSIRKSVDIPVPNVLKWPYRTVFGFGVRNATDPVIVKIINVHRNEFDTIGSFPSRVEVFTLSTGVWRSLSNSKCVPRMSLHLTREVLVIDKFIYWLAFDEGLGYDNTLILSFDVISEEFKEIYLPPILTHTHFSFFVLSKLRESLVVLHYINTSKYDVWLREDGVQNSFRKLYTLKPPIAARHSVLGFRNNGLPIIQIRGNDEARFFVYEPDTGCFNEIGIPGIGHSFPCLAGSYMGTLLLLDH